MLTPEQTRQRIYWRRNRMAEEDCRLIREAFAEIELFSTRERRARRTLRIRLLAFFSLAVIAGALNSMLVLYHPSPTWWIVFVLVMWVAGMWVVIEFTEPKRGKS